MGTKSETRTPEILGKAEIRTLLKIEAALPQTPIFGFLGFRISFGFGIFLWMLELGGWRFPSSRITHGISFVISH